MDALGNVYVADQQNNQILIYAPNGSGGFSAPTSVTATHPGAIAVDASGDIFYADRIDLQPKVDELIPGRSGYSDVTVDNQLTGQPTGVAVTPDGTLYIDVSSLSGEIVSLTPNAGGFADPVVITSGLSLSSGVAVDQEGDVFFADIGGGYVYEVSPSGAGGYGIPTQVDSGTQPTGLATDGFGDLFTAFNGGLVRIHPAAPEVTVISPVANGYLAVGQSVTSAFTCADVPVATLSTCLDGGSQGTGATLNTLTPGSYSYSVTGTSSDGLSTTVTVPYAVAAAPTVTITSPTSGQSYNQGQTATAQFSCSEGAFGPGIGSCLAAGSLTSPATLDTSTPGPHTLVVKAMSLDRQQSTASVTYTVTATTTSTTPTSTTPTTSTPSTTPTTSTTSTTPTQPQTGSGTKPVCKIPQLKGLTLSAATRKLVAAGCVVGGLRLRVGSSGSTFRRLPAPTATQRHTLRVLRLSPAVGTQLKPGAPVALWLAG